MRSREDVRHNRNNPSQCRSCKGIRALPASRPAQDYENVFEAISDLARRYGALDLGQSAAEFGWPQDMLDFAARSIRAGEANQYPPSQGLPVLRDAVALHYRSYQGLKYASEEVVVTSGATEALAATILALVGPDDRVVVFQPAYGAYLPLIRRAGGRPQLLPLRGDTWTPDLTALEQAAADGARVVVLNNPLNPFGSKLDDVALAEFAEICSCYDLVVIADEVWEHTCFDGIFLSTASGSGMRERTVKIGAAGKIFGLMGWKVGWTCSPRKLANDIARMHQNLTFATAPHLQHAVAFGLGQGEDYFENHRRQLKRARDRLANGLAVAGFFVSPSEATHFLTIDLELSGISIKDVEFCHLLAAKAGVAAIPVSAFFDGPGPNRYVRLCFAKTDATIDRAIDCFIRAHELATTSVGGPDIS